ncbi:zinc finger protein 2 homolog [Melitaea cinxia]|uniref:zinc finger protein 2 homolog n=1 Tax=Melitaea cinxia TaxID=113334 RepID=UPI001E26F0E3|nr:zinc finger protein 2 homolog [Melitaea cinxia]
MMFDPPDFPYKELTDSISEHYSTDDILFNSDAVVIDSISNDKDLVKVTEEMISSVENRLTYNSNNAGQVFNIESRSILDAEQNLGLYVLQPDNSLNYEPTLLDDNTVNQFLLPVQTSLNKEKDSENIGPDLLALHSCVICHEIFTTDADLLDHTISVHVSDQPLEQETNLSLSAAINNISSECEWLVCGVCERVLSTALESEPREQLCCTDISGKGSVGSRRLTSMFVCEYCSYLFATGEALDRHRLTCFGQEDIYPEETIIESSAVPLPENYIFCNICGKQCETEEELKHHGVECHKPASRRRPYNTKNSNKMWNCGSCNQLFTTARELYRHKRGEDRPPGTPLTAYVCEECDKVLGSMCALHTHKKMHKVSKPGYPCRVCGRRFNQSGHLAIHMRMHTGERPYPCDLCSKAFKVKVERDDHRRTHTGERPFACAACPKTFTAAARLREHARIHTDQRPYKCDICGAAFRRPYARTVHTLIHTGEKPHECDVCGTAFRRSGDMWKHKRTLHGIQATSGDAK